MMAQARFGTLLFAMRFADMQDVTTSDTASFS